MLSDPCITETMPSTIRFHPPSSRETQNLLMLDIYLLSLWNSCLYITCVFQRTHVRNQRPRKQLTWYSQLQIDNDTNLTLLEKTSEFTCLLSQVMFCSFGIWCSDSASLPKYFLHEYFNRYRSFFSCAQRQQLATVKLSKAPALLQLRAKAPARKGTSSHKSISCRSEV